MSKRRPYLGPSEAQTNAEALARRGLPYAPEHADSVRLAADYRRREPRDLRQAVYQARRIAALEAPAKLHEGPDSIGPDGTPRWTARAEGYIFGNPSADDAGRWQEPVVDETGKPVLDDGGRPKLVTKRDLVGYYVTPQRAALERMAAGRPIDRRRARICERILAGDDPAQAAQAEGAHELDAAFVAEIAVRTLLRTTTDLRLHLPRKTIEPQEVAAA